MKQHNLGTISPLLLYFWQNAPLSGVVVIVNVMFGYKIRHNFAIRWVKETKETIHSVLLFQF